MTKLLLLCLFLVPLARAADPEAEPAAPRPRHYGALFTADFVPAEGIARVSLRIDQDGHLLRELDLAAPEPRYSDFAGDGEIRRAGSRVHWLVPASGGTLTYRVAIDHRRGAAYDARLQPHWALVRLDDLFPAARVRSRVGAESRSRLALAGPKSWHFETRYGPYRGPLDIDTSARRYVRPTGWMIAGELGIRRDRIEERRITIAAPLGQGMRRLDILAYLRWILPDLVRAFPGFPPRLLIAGASDGMWRGGLSGPASMFLHPDRPLISENGTSTLTHELVHIAMGLPGTQREDWIIEGLAEYYSLEIMRRSGGISHKRFEQSIATLRAWARRERAEFSSPSTAAGTARAAVMLHDLAAELDAAGIGRLDGLTRSLLQRDTIDALALAEIAAGKLGHPSKVLSQALGDRIGNASGTGGR